MSGWRRPVAVAVALALGSCAGQYASDSLPKDTAPAFFWGIQKGCKRDAYLSSAVEKRLYQMSSPTGGEVRRLLPGPTILNLPGEAAAVEFRKACATGRQAQTAGILIGGRVEERGGSPPYMLMRLWRYDVATQKVAFRDHYCRGCDVARTLATQAVFLLESPEPAAATQPGLPTFCQSQSPDAAPPVVDSERVLFSLRGGDKAIRGSVQEALKQQLFLTGRELLSVETQRSAPDAGALAEAAVRLLGAASGRGVAKIKANRALVVELAGDGHGQLALASRGAAEGQVASVSCPRCAPEALANRLAREAGRLLDASVEEESGQAPLGTVPAPLQPAVWSVLCSRATTPTCGTEGGTRLDSEPSLTPFYDPYCGELVEGTTSR